MDCSILFLRPHASVLCARFSLTPYPAGQKTALVQFISVPLPSRTTLVLLARTSSSSTIVVRSPQAVHTRLCAAPRNATPRLWLSTSFVVSLHRTTQFRGDYIYIFLVPAFHSYYMFMLTYLPVYSVRCHSQSSPDEYFLYVFISAISSTHAERN
ncbi:hypothetical protein C8J57DRAFT_618867 [Mycena rebaudengoi]|nr:hypothetical protein C8J57DRAFT_618867 [Mycena rebaudengoi]